MTRASAEGGAPSRFRITWDQGAYKVSIPNYQGGDVVRAEIFDELAEALQTAKEALLIFCGSEKVPSTLRVVDAALARATGEQP